MTLRKFRQGKGSVAVTPHRRRRNWRPSHPPGRNHVSSSLKSGAARSNRGRGVAGLPLRSGGHSCYAGKHSAGEAAWPAQEPSMSRSSSRRITTATATSSSGGRPGSRRIPWPASMPSRQDCAKRKVLGDDVAIEIDAYDEMNIRVPIEKIAARIKQPGHSGIVCLVGVQSNQFPRAMAIARQFRARGIAVAIGGFHVSGCISMLKELTPELKEAVDLGITLFAGEAEEQFEPFLKDVACRHGEAGLQLHARPAEPAAPDDPLSAAAAGQALRRHALLVRRGPRLPVPVLVLHHHQRAGPQVALARRRRHRAHRARERARRASRASSSPTTISPATRTGSRSSTG